MEFCAAAVKAPSSSENPKRKKALAIQTPERPRNQYSDSTAPHSTAWVLPTGRPRGRSEKTKREWKARLGPLDSAGDTTQTVVSSAAATNHLPRRRQ